MSTKFFDKDPIVSWQKVLCPVCSEPTGPKSKCYENPPKDMPEHKRKLVSKTSGIMPIYSRSCAFRQNNLWSASINYPISDPLISRLRTIPGVDGIIPVKIHTFQVAIGDLFEEKNVKQCINAAFRAFIKEMNIIERNLSGENQDVKLKPQYKGIIFPNGNEWKPVGVTEDEAMRNSLLVENLLDFLPEAKGIFA